MAGGLTIFFSLLVHNAVFGKDTDHGGKTTSLLWRVVYVLVDFSNASTGNPTHKPAPHCYSMGLMFFINLLCFHK